MYAKNGHNDLNDELFGEQVEATMEQIYRAHLPPYLQKSWVTGKGVWYEDWLREQIDILVISEICDDLERLAQLEEIRGYVTLVFGIFGTTFRMLDHMGMHLRGQTLGQYELLPQDEALLHELCQRFLQLRQSGLKPAFLA